MTSRTRSLLTAALALGAGIAIGGLLHPTAIATAGETAPGGYERLLDPDARELMTFKVDPVHSSVIFRIGHMGVANFYGRFNTIGGRYAIDRSNPEGGSFEIEIDAASVDTNGKNRDDHLKSADFFDVEKHAKIIFKSTSVQKKSGDVWTVSGDLTLLGERRPITAEAKLIGMGDTRQGYKSGVEVRFTIKRSEFGMDKYIAEGGLSDEVDMIVSMEARREDQPG